MDHDGEEVIGDQICNPSNIKSSLLMDFSYFFISKLYDIYL